MKQPEIVELVRQGKYRANPLARCVDGRYNGDSEPGAIAMPGADLNLLFAGLGACNRIDVQIYPEAILEALIHTVGGVKNIRLHTDVHAESEDRGPAMGCGHVKNALFDYETYKLNWDQAQFIMATIPALVAAGAKQDVLAGNHQETAVLIVESEHFSIKPSFVSTKNPLQAFVYQKTLTEDRFRQFSRQLLPVIREAGLSISDITLDRVIRETAEAQLKETLARLAPGKPVYNVTITADGNFAVYT